MCAGFRSCPGAGEGAVSEIAKVLLPEHLILVCGGGQTLKQGNKVVMGGDKCSGKGSRCVIRRAWEAWE